MKREDRILSEYADQLAALTRTEDMALSQYSPADAARVFRVMPSTVRNWIAKGWIKAEQILVEKHTETKRHRTVAINLIKAEEIDRIQTAGPRLIKYTMRSWPRILYKLEQGDENPR